MSSNKPRKSVLTCLLLLAIIGLTVCFFPACSQEGEKDPSGTPPAATSSATETRHQEFLSHQHFTGDFDKMNKRHKVRALVVYNDMFYFFDRGHPHGATYEFLKEFEKFLNRHLKKGTIKIQVIFIPTTRDRLLKDLVAGRGDLAAANLTITPARQHLVDFSIPIIENVRELLVTGPKAPKLTKLEDLAGREIMVRKSSSYYEHLQQLNRKLKKAGKKPVRLKAAPPYLEDSDLLEMVSSGILPWAVVDEHKARFWVTVYDHLTLRDDLVLHQGGKIAWALRKKSPRLKKLVNQFIRKNRHGTLVGNIIIKRYLKNHKWLKNPNSARDRKRFAEVVKLFRKYGRKYHFDYLMLMALAYQESHLDQNKRSRAGAVGIMQILKKTASDPRVGISHIEKLENNIAAGSKYLRYLYDRYYAGEPKMDKLNKMLFTFASYNAGPSKIARMRKLAAKMGLNPNIWFNNVELVVAKKIGRETVQYVSNIYKYYVAYRLVAERRTRTDASRKNGSPPR